MRKAKVLEIIKYDYDQRSNRNNRIVVKVEYDGGRYYLDVTEELSKHNITYSNCDVENLRKSIPEYIYASFYELRFRISKSSMKKWMNNLNVN